MAITIVKERTMQLIKKTNKKVIAIALAAVIVSSSLLSSSIVADDSVIQTEPVDTISLDGSQKEVVDSNVSDKQIDGLVSEETAGQDEGSVINVSSSTSQVSEQAGLEISVDEKAVKTSSNSFTGFAKDGNGWHFYLNNVQKKGWINYKGNRYYVINTYALPQNMWRKINGYLYYFNKDGVMIKDQRVKIDGVEYQFDKNGHKVNLDNSKKLGDVTPDQQALYDLGAKILKEEASNVRNGIMNDAGKWYKYVNNARTRGWYQEGNKTMFFLNTLNRAENMWRKIQGKTYYFEADGRRVTNTVKYIDGRTYKFGTDGALVENANTSLVNYNVSVRGKADESSDVVGQLKKGNGVEIIGKSGSYVKVRTGNSSFDGWVRSSAVVTESQAKLDRVIAVAKSKLGTSYVWGATGPNTFDCSGLMLYAFRNGAGITLPRVSKHQATVGTYVSRQNLRPGDLIFWGRPVHHVAMYIGDGKYIHAPYPGTTVQIARLGAYTTARRIIN